MDKKKPGLAIILEAVKDRKKSKSDDMDYTDDMEEMESDVGEEESMLASDILEAVDSGDPDLLAQSLKDFVKACMSSEEY